jgi:hypothetical protein
MVTRFPTSPEMQAVSDQMSDLMGEARAAVFSPTPLDLLVSKPTIINAETGEWGYRPYLAKTINGRIVSDRRVGKKEARK